MQESYAKNFQVLSMQEESLSRKLWRYGKEVLKGAALVCVATIGYVSLRRFGENSNEKALLGGTNTGSKGNRLNQAVSFLKDKTHLAKISPPLTNHRSKRAPLSGEFQVNTNTNGRQERPVLTALSNGNFVVSWISYNGYDGSGTGVSGQLFDSTAGKVGSEFQVNTYTTGNQFPGGIAALGGGGFVVTVAGVGPIDSLGIVAQRFNSAGGKVGSEFLVNTYTPGFQSSPSIATLGTGGFVVVWTSYGQDTGSSDGVYGQIFNSVGVKIGSEFRVNNYTIGDQGLPRVATLSSGAFVVTWQSDAQDGSGEGIYCQLFTSAGGKIGSEFQVNTYTNGDQSTVALAALNNFQRFIVAWHSDTQDGSSLGVYAQRMRRVGSRAVKEDTEFQVNTYTTNTQGLADITVLSDDKFVITWVSRDQDGSDFGVYGQLFDRLQYKFGSEFQINTYTTSSQHYPKIATLSNGNLVVVWSSFGQDADGSSGIYGKLLLNKNITLQGVSTRAYTEDTTYSFSTAPLTIDDLYYQPSVLTRLMIPTGVGSLSTPSQGGVVPTFSSKTGVWEARGSIVNINAMFNKLEFIPALDYNIGFKIFINVSDSFSPAIGYSTMHSPDYHGVLQMNAIPVNDLPVIANNKIPLTKGEKKLVLPSHLSATDVEQDDKTLMFIFTNLKHIHFENIDFPGVKLNNVTQQAIQDSKIQIVHDGSSKSPSCEVEVSDGVGSTSPVPLGIQYPTNVVALSVGIGVGGLALAGILVGIGFWRHKVNKRNAEEGYNEQPMQELSK